MVAQEVEDALVVARQPAARFGDAHVELAAEGKRSGAHGASMPDNRLLTETFCAVPSYEMTDALPLPGDARYLKAGLPSGRQLTDPQVVERVSAMLLEIERDGMDAVRRHSQQLDGWAPDGSR